MPLVQLSPSKTLKALLQGFVVLVHPINTVAYSNYAVDGKPVNATLV